MKSSIFMNGEKFVEVDFAKEIDFESLVIKNSKTLFGSNTIYFDLKNKIKSQSLGNSIPDGFLFDFRDIENPEFYLVEVELAKHDFYKHIFPQITKFFAFFKNPESQGKLIEKLFSIFETDEQLRNDLKSRIGNREIFKFLKDTIENSQNILLIS